MAVEIATRVAADRVVGGVKAIQAGLLGGLVKERQVLRAGVAGGCLHKVHGGDHAWKHAMKKIKRQYHISQYLQGEAGMEGLRLSIIADDCNAITPRIAGMQGIEEQEEVRKSNH